MKRLHDDTNDNRIYQGDRLKVRPTLSEGIFKNLFISLLPTGIGQTRCKLFASQIKSNEGKICRSLDSNTTHLIVDDSLDWEAITKIIKDIDVTTLTNLKIVKSKWLSQCLKEKQMLSTEELEIKPAHPSPMPSKKDSAAERNYSKLNIESSRPTSSETQDLLVYNSEMSSHLELPADTTSNPPASNVTGKWVCSYSSANKPANHNKHITDKLQQMAETYRSSKDQWRTYSYEKVINTLKTWPKEVCSLEEAHSIPGVGARLAEKIWEIIESGSFRKLEETNSNEDFKAINLFTQVWGAGPSTAQSWLLQGFRTLEDLKTKAKLTNQQQIGLKHYTDLLEKMPWEEAAEIVEKVKEVALKLNKDLQVIGCGSFRRGKPWCGDVDILITHPDGKSQTGILDPIVHRLTESGFLTDHLVNPEAGGAHQTYMGVCRLAGQNRMHRRLDLFVIPSDEFGPALLAYTGSGHFNRSMRLLARKKGMALSHKSLRAGVIRKGAEKVCDGYALPTPTEESVFKHLGLEYRKPEERDH